jgi:ATP-dependent helicase/nuclease subunit A
MPPNANNALPAIDPRRNAVVHAAAGTGKTWLLVSRVIRLLLEGVKPSSILAITFTRKAASEMRLRIGQRLLEMAQATQPQLSTMLEDIGIDTSAEMSARARRLYEQLLVAPHELRATTFHAFCQELLSRFAFEAGVPPSFGLIEQTAEIEAAAYRALDRDLAGRDADLINAMDRLLQDLGTLENTRKALQEFLTHRSDWWAYSENEPDPVAYATNRLQTALEIDPTINVLDLFANDAQVRGLMQSLTDEIARETPPSLVSFRGCLERALASSSSAEFYRLVWDALITKNEEKVRAFKIPKRLAELLGADTVETLIRQRETLLDCLKQTIDHQKRHATWQRTRDWYVVGTRLLHHFQEEKRAEGALDFTDLEWFAYRMLNQSRHAEWVQYKLDQRIDHLLVDEFQDTNPTQWRLLLPLLQEMAAGSNERSRSVFLVGDEKQSIYRFRRADPNLFNVARNWLTEHAAAQVYDQHISWRSSPAVLHFVNLVFDQPTPDTPVADGEHRLKDFRTHETYREELWGHAELLPLILRDTDEAVSPNLRDPLMEPRVTPEDKRREREGNMVAKKIRSLIGRPIFRNRKIQPLGYGDIMILMRSRTHASAYEAALRRVGIPYIGAGRGTFLDCLEVRDILGLLRLLISPWDNVALATVLRSPIFAASNDDLLALADLDSSASWFERLTECTNATSEKAGSDAHNVHIPQLDTLPPSGENAATSLVRAAKLLVAWRELADRVPVHDLLDRIYFEANVPERYAAAAPIHLRQRIAANLTRLLDLALEADGGRFPSLARFLSRLEALTSEDSESLDAGGDEAGDQVRIMTVHAAKGLESPVVFLVDAARDTNANERGADALIEWPIEQTRPSNFVLLGRKSDIDEYTAAVVQRRAAKAFQEESNLLYVALTRAQQLLFVSGSESGRRKGDGPDPAGDLARGWYGHIERRLEVARRSGLALKAGAQLQAIVDSSSGETINLCGVVTHGLPPILPVTPSPALAVVSIDPALTRPFTTPLAKHEIGTTAEEEIDEAALPPGVDVAILSAARQRGIVIHRMLERLTADGADRNRAKRQIWHEFAGDLNSDRLTDYWNEACRVIDAPDLRRFFDPTHYNEARNEVTVLYRADGRDVTGVIDRLLIRDDALLLVDYKTLRVDTQDIATMVDRHTPQLRRYAEGLRQLWPEKPIEAVLILTTTQISISVNI